MPRQTQTQRLQDPLQHAQQMVPDARPQAYSHAPQADLRAQQPARRDETMLAPEESRRWGRQALEEIREIERAQYDGSDEDDEYDD
jgi:hypothetical protein